MKVTLEISDAVCQSTGMARDNVRREAKKELALAFYARGLLSLGKAVELAETTRMEFESWLAERKIERPFSVEEVEKEIAWALEQGD